MPYGTTKDLPDQVKALPQHGQEIWLAAFNAAFKEYHEEEKAFAAAWAAVERRYRKEGDRWVAREEEAKYLKLVLKEIDGVPEEFLLLPEGEIAIEGEEPAVLDAACAQRVIEEFERRGNDMVIDYEHQTLQNVQAPAAGWITKLRYVAGEGIRVAVTWTQKAKDYLANREYRYFSPVFWLDKARRVVMVENVALTNSPKLNNLKPIMAKLVLGSTDNLQRKENTMWEKLKKLLNLSADASEEKTIEAVTQLVAKNQALEGRAACKEVATALGAKEDAGKDELVRLIAALSGRVACKEIAEALGAKEGAGKDEVMQIIAGLKATPGAAVALSQEVAALKSKIAAMEQQDLVALALKEGKTSPEELDKWGRDLALKSPEQFKLIVLSRPAGSVVPLDRIQIEGKTARTSAVDEIQREINKQMGISDETWKKFNQGVA